MEKKKKRFRHVLRSYNKLARRLSILKRENRELKKKNHDLAIGMQKEKIRQSEAYEDINFLKQENFNLLSVINSLKESHLRVLEKVGFLESHLRNVASYLVESSNMMAKMQINCNETKMLCMESFSNVPYRVRGTNFSPMFVSRIKKPLLTCEQKELSCIEEDNQENEFTASPQFQAKKGIFERKCKRGLKYLTVNKISPYSGSQKSEDQITNSEEGANKEAVKLESSNVKTNTPKPYTVTPKRRTKLNSSNLALKLKSNTSESNEGNNAEEKDQSCETFSDDQISSQNDPNFDCGTNEQEPTIKASETVDSLEVHGGLSNCSEVASVVSSSNSFEKMAGMMNKFEGIVDLMSDEESPLTSANSSDSNHIYSIKSQPKREVKKKAEGTAKKQKSQKGDNPAGKLKACVTRNTVSRNLKERSLSPSDTSFNVTVVPKNNCNDLQSEEKELSILSSCSHSFITYRKCRRTRNSCLDSTADESEISNGLTSTLKEETSLSLSKNIEGSNKSHDSQYLSSEMNKENVSLHDSSTLISDHQKSSANGFTTSKKLKNSTPILKSKNSDLFKIVSSTILSSKEECKKRFDLHSSSSSLGSPISPISHYVSKHCNTTANSTTNNSGNISTDHFESNTRSRRNATKNACYKEPALNCKLRR